MGAIIGVEIEHRRLVRLLELDGPSTGALSLTTMADRQGRAIIRVFAEHEGRQDLVHEVSVRAIPPMPAGTPRIDLHGRFDGRHTLMLSVQLEGRTHTSTTVDVRRWTRRRKTGWFLVVAALLLAVSLMGVWWWLSPRDTVSQPRVAITGEQDAREPEAPEVAETETLPPSSNEVESASDEAPEPSEAEPEEPPADVAPQEPERGAEPSAEEVTEETQGNAGGEGASASVRPSVQDAPAAKTEAAPVEEEVTEGTQGNADSEEASTSVWPSVQAQRLAEGKAARVYFPPDSAELTAPAKAELDAILHVLSRNAGKPVAIVGHCALFGTEQGRIELSEARARHVRRYLLDAGWQPAKDPATRGVGAAEPLTREPDGQAKNRRVELRFVDSAS